MINILFGAGGRFRKRSQRRLYTHYGPWAIVTGASSGIGREMALRLGEVGLSGLLSKFLASSLVPLPRSLRVRIMGTVNVRHGEAQT